MELINLVNNPYFFVAVASLFGLYLVTLSVVLALWTARDIRVRTHSVVARVAAPLFVLVFGFAGFVPYLVLRPRQTFAEREAERRDVLLLAEAAKKFECPTCFAAVEPDFAHCPQCQAEFKPVCQCGVVLNQSWNRCPFCASVVAGELKKKKFVTPIPAIDLPPQVESPKQSKQSQALVSGKLSARPQQAKRTEPEVRQPQTRQPQVHQPKTEQPQPRPTIRIKADNISFGGFSASIRRALAIKR